MLITYLRSSSWGAHNWCEHNYYLSYVLGLPNKVNIKAEKGTIVHKVMQCLAQLKVCKERGEDYFDDDTLGRVHSHDDSPNILTELAFRDTKKRRPDIDWQPQDLTECKNWVAKALELNNGELDPRNQKIVAVEQFFDFPLLFDWADYKYDMTDGSTLEGKLRIRGTIDLLVEEGSNTLHIIDYKTGRRLDWAKNKEKSFDAITQDYQLLLYYYATHSLFPQYEHTMCTIYYINDGGPFTVSFDKTMLSIIENNIKEKFEQIKNVFVPKLTIDWKCKAFCGWGAKGGLVPGTKKTQCEFYKDEIAKYGPDTVYYLHGNKKSFDVENYSGGGKNK